MTYPTKKLGEVCEIKKGKKPHLKSKQGNGDAPYLTAKFMRGTAEPEYASLKDKNSVAVLPNEIIVICDGSNSGDIFTDFEGVLASTMGKVVHGKDINTQYLRIFLESNFERFNGAKKGAAIPHLDIAGLYRLEIPLPPLAEQRKIVAKIEKQFAKMDEAARLRAESQALTNQLLPATLHEIFSELKHRYISSDLGEAARLVRGPFGGSLKKEIFVPSGYAVYEQGNVIDEEPADFRYFITIAKFNEMKRFAVAPGDILMSCSGTIGRFVVISNNFVQGVINQALLKITPSTDVLPEYLKLALQDYIAESTGYIMGSAIKNIVAVSELRKIKIALPPLTEQRKIVKKLDALSEKVRVLAAFQSVQTADLKALKQSILREAFKN